MKNLRFIFIFTIQNCYTNIWAKEVDVINSKKSLSYLKCIKCNLSHFIYNDHHIQFFNNKFLLNYHHRRFHFPN